MKRYIMIVLISGIIFNLGILGYYKYKGFFIDTINHLFSVNIVTSKIALPLGISFFTFQQISFLIDVYKDREANESFSLVEYASFVTFFPQLVAGPIVPRDVLIPQFRNTDKKTFMFDNFAKGLAFFTLGMAKKVLIADTFGKLVDVGYSNVSSLNSIEALLCMLGYTFQIYMDFSGYSDMAVGLGWMMNIDLPVNFDSPYRAESINDFWKRWHISLTSFFTKYLYIPLGGNRYGIRRTSINILIVFFLSGLWHGAGWTFIFWGIIHGVALVIEKLFQNVKVSMPYVIRWLITFSFVNVAWIFFRAQSLEEAFVFISRLYFCNSDTVNSLIFSDMMTAIRTPELSLVLIKLFGNGIAPYVELIILFIIGFIAIFMPNSRVIAIKSIQHPWAGAVYAGLMIVCLFSFSGISEFLYFNF